MQGAQKLRSEAHLQVRRNDEVEAQRSRWTFYETIILNRTSNGRRESEGYALVGAPEELLGGNPLVT